MTESELTRKSFLSSKIFSGSLRVLGNSFSQFYSTYKKTKKEKMIKSEVSEVLARRLALDTEDYINIQRCWDEETKILSCDISQTINFIENECDDETFCWIGEVFEDVAEITQSKEFVAAIKRRRNVQVDVRYAEDSLFTDE